MHNIRNVSSFHKKQSDKSVYSENTNISGTKSAIPNSQNEKHNENISTFICKIPISGSTPVLPQLLSDLEDNYIFKQQKQKNRRSKSIDFLSTNTSGLLEDYKQRNTQTTKSQNQRKSLSATNLPVSFYHYSFRVFISSSKIFSFSLVYLKL